MERKKNKSGLYDSYAMIQIFWSHTIVLSDLSHQNQIWLWDRLDVTNIKHNWFFAIFVTKHHNVKDAAVPYEIWELYQLNLNFGLWLQKTWNTVHELYRPFYGTFYGAFIVKIAIL